MNDVSWKQIKTWSKDSLRTANKEFLKNPSSTNWTACLRAMMVWQQVEYTDTSVMPAAKTNIRALEIQLGLMQAELWPDQIVKVILNMSMEEALKH